jgi:hypothetical protein
MQTGRPKQQFARAKAQPRSNQAPNEVLRQANRAPLAPPIQKNDSRGTPVPFGGPSDKIRGILPFLLWDRL